MALASEAVPASAPAAAPARRGLEQRDLVAVDDPVAPRCADEHRRLVQQAGKHVGLQRVLRHEMGDEHPDTGYGFGR
jgi:hypothetical protein